MIQKLKTFWRCKILKQHFLVRTSTEVMPCQEVHNIYTCKYCGVTFKERHHLYGWREEYEKI